MGPASTRRPIASGQFGGRQGRETIVPACDERRRILQVAPAARSRPAPRRGPTPRELRDQPVAPSGRSAHSSPNSKAVDGRGPNPATGGSSAAPRFHRSRADESAGPDLCPGRRAAPWRIADSLRRAAPSVARLRRRRSGLRAEKTGSPIGICLLTSASLRLIHRYATYRSLTRGRTSRPSRARRIDQRAHRSFCERPPP